MTLSDLYNMGELALGVVGGACALYYFVHREIKSGDADVKQMVHEMSSSLGSMLAKQDLSLANLTENLDRDFVRRREWELSQSDANRRLSGIEAKLDRLPVDIATQTDRILAAMRDQGQR